MKLAPGWLHSDCNRDFGLFGKNLASFSVSKGSGVFWKTFRGDENSLAELRMAVRPHDYVSRRKQIGEVYSGLPKLFEPDTRYTFACRDQGTTVAGSNGDTTATFVCGRGGKWDRQLESVECKGKTRGEIELT